jgi:hypothetical protein
MGMNVPGCDNRKLAPNIVQWLSQLKPEWPRGDRAREASPRFWGIAGFTKALPLDDLSFRRSPRVR